MNKEELLKGELDDIYRKYYFDLKKRIDKAIEYINKNGILDLNGYDLLNILRGVDNESN